MVLCQVKTLIQALLIAIHLKMKRGKESHLEKAMKFPEIECCHNHCACTIKPGCCN